MEETAKFYLSLFFFLLTVLCFPILQDAVLAANITDAGLSAAITNFPLILLMFIGVLPVYYGIEAKTK